ncbi:MAG: hypothetical protein KTR31_42040 [Myxococcales bacterium]|nr:hypothetical protein [Myxococcales bacterium]
MTSDGDPDTSTADTSTTPQPTRAEPQLGPATVRIYDALSVPQEAYPVIVHALDGSFVEELATDELGTAFVMVEAGAPITVIIPDPELSITIYDVQWNDVITLGPSTPVEFVGPFVFAGPSDLEGADEYGVTTSCLPYPYNYDPADTLQLSVPTACLAKSDTFDAVAWAYEDVPRFFDGRRPIAWSTLEGLPGKPAAHVFSDWRTDLIETTLTMELPEPVASPGLDSARLIYGLLRPSGPMVSDVFVWRNLHLHAPEFDLAFPSDLAVEGGWAWVTASRTLPAGQLFSETTYVMEQTDVSKPWTVSAPALARRLHASWNRKSGQVDLELTASAGKGAGFLGWVNTSSGSRVKWGFVVPPDQVTVVPPELPATWASRMPAPKGSVTSGSVTWYEVPGLSWDALRQGRVGGEALFSSAIPVEWLGVPDTVLDRDTKMNEEP